MTCSISVSPGLSGRLLFPPSASPRTKVVYDLRPRRISRDFACLRTSSNITAYFKRFLKAFFEQLLLLRRKKREKKRIRQSTPINHSLGGTPFLFPPGPIFLPYLVLLFYIFISSPLVMKGSGLGRN